jgi:sec-independent protein translocase protein TatB
MPFGLGFGETLLILAVIVLFFGPKRIPEAAASLGKGIREFRKSVAGIGEELQAPLRENLPVPPHSTLAGTGVDPRAVPLGADPLPVPEVPSVLAASPLAGEPAAEPAPSVLASLSDAPAPGERPSPQG